jgi:pyruvate/2-oxoglutarate dehydrogenase complex dihydrolipoamide acyltransferase (E2) component
MYWRKLRHDAFLVKKTMGTVVVTSVGMFGKFSGHIIPIGVHTLGFGLGGIIKKPGVIGDKIEIREYLSMTVSVDHDIVDGAPLARFVARLTELVENAFGLIDEV